MRKLLLGTPLPDGLAADGRAVIALLRADAPQPEKAERAFAFIYAMGGETFRYHFAEPLARLGVGLVTRKAVEVASSVALAGMRGPMRRVLSGMTDAQLRQVADEIEGRLYPDPHA